MVTITLICVPLFYWSHKSHEFTRNDPVGVTVLDSLVIFILLDIERSEIIPFELYSVLETLQALQQGALIQTITFTRISVRLE